MSRYDPNKHHRRSLRLRGWDYTWPGAYFVTIVAHHREMLFGEVADGKVVLSEWGQIVAACWAEIPAHFDHVVLDAWVVMPNHLHGILFLTRTGEGEAGGTGEGVSRLYGAGGTGVSRPLPRPYPPRGVARGSLGAVIGSFKSAVTRRINERRGTPGASVWQRNYWEHIIRNERELIAIRKYIHNNPARWAEDAL